MNGNELHRKVCALGLAVWAILSASVATAGPSSDPATTPTSAPATQPAGKVVFPLNRAAPQPLRKYTLDEIAAMFPAFKHEPFDSAGYNQFSLPIHYEDRGGDGDPNEAMAMSFLLSHALDWGEGCYCSRHAYFIFKRCAKYMPALKAKYDPKLIAYLVEDWQATHGVGGKLIRCKEGYAGELTIFDREGKIVKEIRYEKPREFFELLGDMSVDGITFLSGSAPTPELANHLHVKQCENRQSLIDLGKAAFVEERSDEEWAIYDGILKRDPGFSAVRYWRANQKWWEDDDSRAKALEMARSLDSYITLSAMEYLKVTQCPDKELAAKYPQWRKRVAELAGPNSTLVMGWQLSEAIARGRAPHELIEKATALGAKYPNDYPYLLKLAVAWSNGDDLQVDLDMACSILFAAWQNNFLPGSDTNKTYAAGQLAEQAFALGHYDLCVDLLMPLALEGLKTKGPENVAWRSWMLGKALFQMGRFDESWKWFRMAYLGWPNKSEDAAQAALIGGACSAAHAGRRDIVAQILRDRRDVLDFKKASGLVQGYLDVLDGKPINSKALWAVKNPPDRWFQTYLMMLQVESDMIQGIDEEKQSHIETDFARYEAHDRALQILSHEVFRQHPDKAPSCFYEMLQLMRPDDPWVRQAVTEWRGWGNRPALPDPAKHLEDLKDFVPVRWPEADPARQATAGELFRKYRVGTHACAVGQLIKAGKLDQAEELALRYLHLATDTQQYDIRVHASWLVHRVEQARQAKRGTVSPDDL
jgi:tetratricopeptide (TPR) repeat protein